MSKCIDLHEVIEITTEVTRQPVVFTMTSKWFYLIFILVVCQIYQAPIPVVRLNPHPEYLHLLQNSAWWECTLMILKRSSKPKGRNCFLSCVLFLPRISQTFVHYKVDLHGGYYWWLHQNTLNSKANRFILPLEIPCKSVCVG